jgi:5-methylthioadenosine/S-adenosylhomocysteine deaminase
MIDVDMIVRNGIVLTMDRQNTVYDRGVIAISGNTIRWVGNEGSPFPFSSSTTIDARGGIISPGLVNSHTHAAMSLFRGLADDLPLMQWLNDYIFPVERRMDQDFVYTGAILACAEMILSGTTTFCDMYLFEEATALAARDAGMRCVLGEVFYDFPSPNYGEIDRGFDYVEEMIHRWRDDPLISIAVEPHSLYTCAPELLQRAAALATRHGLPLITHVAETTSEIDEIYRRYRKTPFQHMNDLGLLDSNLIAVHCVHVGEADISLMSENRVKVVTTPESNMKLASGIAPVKKLQDAGITVGIGTDGCASNNDLDMFGEMDTTAKLGKVSTMDPTTASAPSVLRMATIQGAKALGMEATIGSIEEGKSADIIIVDTSTPHMTPMYDPFSHLVYAANGGDVTHTIIGGRLVMENRRLITLNIEDVLDAARSKQRKVLDWLNGQGSRKDKAA